MAAAKTKKTPASPRRAAPLSAKPGGTREQTAQTTRDNILKAATKVFARYGYDGGSVEKISRSAKSFDRMIYYYFGSKEGLFIEVLEDMYRRMNDAELALSLDVEQPVESLKEVICFVVSYYAKNPEFITLLNTENLLRGRHIARSEHAREYSSPALALTARILAAGASKGLFRGDITARDLYLMIAALAYFYLSNRYTLSAFLGEDLCAPAALAHWEGFIVDAVMRKVAAH